MKINLRINLFQVKKKNVFLKEKAKEENQKKKNKNETKTKCAIKIHFKSQIISHSSSLPPKTKTNNFFKIQQNHTHISGTRKRE